MINHCELRAPALELRAVGQIASDLQQETPATEINHIPLDASSRRWQDYAAGHRAAEFSVARFVETAAALERCGWLAGRMRETVAPSPGPVLFSVSDDGRGQAAIWHTTTGEIAESSSPAVAGEALSMYTTSLADDGVIPPQSPSVAGSQKSCNFGTSGYPGYNQVNFRVPNDVAPEPAVAVRLTYLGRASNEVTIAVR